LTVCCIYRIICIVARTSSGIHTTTGEAPDHLYNRIAVLRMERGLSRQGLADLVGVNYQTIGYLERGDYNPSLQLAFRLCEVFGLPIEAVFARSPFRPMSEELYQRGQAEEAPRNAAAERERR
jgi:DNA-binding XRE family transcriptional regulator